MTYYVGGETAMIDQLGVESPRYFYGLRLDATGYLYFARIDQLTENFTLIINTPGASGGNFENFEYGVDYFDGQLASDHSRPYTNLNYQQYRWDGKNMYYYIDNTGELVARVNQQYSGYPA
jgi:hypothetical protein